MSVESTDWISRLATLLGDGQMTCDDEVLTSHSGDKWSASHLPEAVVFAESTADVVAVMKFASEHGIPVTTRGAGVGYVGGCVPVRGGIALSVMRMNRILGMHPEDGVAVVQPGVITRDLQEAARAVGWEYPPDPASLKECSIGGNIATNAGGPRCLKYGVTRSYVTEAVLRLIPKPAARAMLAAVFPEFAMAAAAVQAILNAGHLPSALEITDGFTLDAARKRLGAEVFPPGNAHLIVEIDGRAAAVAAELEEIHMLLERLGAGSIERAPDEASCERIWRLRREFSYSLRDTGLTKLNEDIVVPRSRLVELVEFAARLQAQTGIPVACFGHAGDGNIHTNLMVGDYGNPEVRATAEHALDLLFAWVLENGGAITGEHGVGLAKKRWIGQALGGVSLDVHRAIKRALDGGDLLNPGKFL